MGTQRTLPPMSVSIASAGIAGVLLALLPYHLSFAVGGAGHGTILPLYGFFGPVCWLGRQFQAASPTQSFPLEMAEWGMLVLYGLYGVIVAALRWYRRGVWGLLACLVAHYAAVVFLVMAFEPVGQLRTFAAVLPNIPLLHAILLFEYFLALHLLAMQYAQSVIPYRPRWTRTAAGVLLAGLLASVACYAWGRSLL